MLQEDPNKRPTLKEIRAHPWLQFEVREAGEDGTFHRCGQNFINVDVLRKFFGPIFDIGTAV